MRRKKEKPVVVISDLHVDRWENGRKEMFFEFLDHVVKTAKEMYVLGDIFDFPPLKGETVWPGHREIITRLRSLPERGIPLTYVIGNHDLSLRGIELDEGGFTMTYCDRKRCLVREIYGARVFMDHGHFHDPLFKEHIYDAIDFLRNVTGEPVDRRAVDFFRDVVRIFQREPKRKAAPGRKERTPGEVGVPERFLKIWEDAAEQVSKEMRCDAVVFGHTHAPGITPVAGGGKLYVNSGDWTTHATYVEFTPGKISLRDWTAAAPLKEVPMPVKSSRAYR
ncbi:MAG: UDP-2,3-diacylglucosamine diphosphatase [bacterium]